LCQSYSSASRSAGAKQRADTHDLIGYRAGLHQENMKYLSGKRSGCQDGSRESQDAIPMARLICLDAQTSA
jgi:hypothetical protein